MSDDNRMKKIRQKMKLKCGAYIRNFCFMYFTFRKKNQQKNNNKIKKHLFE